MTRFRICSRPSSAIALLALAAAVLLSAPRPARAGGPPYGIPSGVMPWEYGKYQGYREPARRGSPALPAAPVARSPVKYTIRITTLPYQHTYDDPNVALVVAHVPEDARIWFDGDPTVQTGDMRYFASPSLTPGRKYAYTIQVQWYEDGHWVSQTHTFPVRAGGVHCLDLIPARSQDVEKEVAASMAKLPAEDRKAAEEQKFCAVQDGVRLGSMGVPVKVSVKGQPVFLCCKGCEKKAKSDAGRTLEQVRKLKTQSAPGSP